MQAEKDIKLLYSVGIGLILSDIIPTPADAVYFNRERINKRKLEKGEITAKQYWTKDAINYYALNAFWWAGVLGVSVSFGKTFEQKRNMLIGLIAAGAVVGVLYRNVKKDEDFYSKNILVPKNEELK